MFLIKIGLKNQWFFHKKNDGKAWIFQEKQWKTWIFISFFLKFIEFFKENRVFQWKVMRKHDFEWKNHEQPWFSMKNHGKNLDFHSKSAKNLEFLGFCAPRKQKNGKSYKMRPRRGTAGGRAPKGCAPRSGAQPFGANMWIQSLSRKMFSCKLENFFRSKNRTCVGPHRLGKFQPEISSPLQWKAWFLKILGAPERAQRAVPGGLGGARGEWQGSSAPRASKTRKIMISKGRGSLFHGILEL